MLLRNEFGLASCASETNFLAARILKLEVMENVNRAHGRSSHTNPPFIFSRPRETVWSRVTRFSQQQTRNGTMRKYNEDEN